MLAFHSFLYAKFLCQITICYDTRQINAFWHPNNAALLNGALRGGKVEWQSRFRHFRCSASLPRGGPAELHRWGELPLWRSLLKSGRLHVCASSPGQFFCNSAILHLPPRRMAERARKRKKGTSGVLAVTLWWLLLLFGFPYQTEVMGFKKRMSRKLAWFHWSPREMVLGQEHHVLALNSVQGAVDHQMIMRRAKSQDGASGSTTQGWEESRIRGQVGWGRDQEQGLLTQDDLKMTWARCQHFNTKSIPAVYGSAEQS